MLITQKYEVKLKEKMHKVHMSIKICQNPHNVQVLYKNLEIISSHSLCEALFVKLCDYLEVSFAPYHDQNHGQSLAEGDKVRELGNLGSQKIMEN